MAQPVAVSGEQAVSQRQLGQTPPRLLQIIGKHNGVKPAGKAPRQRRPQMPKYRPEPAGDCGGLYVVASSPPSPTTAVINGASKASATLDHGAATSMVVNHKVAGDCSELAGVATAAASC